MIKPHSFLIFLACAAGASAQCPRIDFQSAGQQTLVNAAHNATIVSGLQRVADGSFTQHIFTGNVRAGQSSKIGTVEHAEQGFFTCVGLPARTLHPGPPNVRDDKPGIASSRAIVTDLTGNGAGSFVFLSPFAGKDQFTVGLINSDVTGGSAKYYNAGRNPQGIVAGDFNGDGKHDVAVVYSGPGDGVTPGGISLFLGNGDGTLQPAVNYPAGNFSNGMTAFDFNHDGRTDLAVTSFNDNTVLIFLANADGTLRTPVPYTIPGSGLFGSFPDNVLVGDANGDTKPDLLVACSNGVGILYGNGDGTFSTGRLLPTRAIFPRIAAGDFNKDGNLDVAITDYFSGLLYVYLGMGGGNFGVPTPYTGAQQISERGGVDPGNFFVEDFDGDGNLDLVFASGHPDVLVPDSSDQVISVLYGNGDGTFAGVHYSLTPVTPPNIVLADFNGDGKLDLASVGRLSTTISVAMGRGDGSFQPITTTSLESVQFAYAAAADLNGDGKADLLAGTIEGSVDVLLSKGDGTFFPPQPVSAGTDAQFIAVGDFNHDGKPDLAVVNGVFNGDRTANAVSVVLGTGNGAFGAAAPLTTGSNPVFIQVTDLNHDGFPDLIVVNNGTFTSESDLGDVAVLMGKGDGSFQNAVHYPAGTNPTSVSVADFDGDGKLDLMVTGGQFSSGTLALLKGNGDGTFRPATTTPTEFGPSAAAAADFDGDGKLDLVVAHCCGDTATTYLVGNGDGTFQPEVEFSLMSLNSLALGDLNGDHKPDIAFAAEMGQAGGLGASPRPFSGSTGAEGAVDSTSFASGGIGAYINVAGFEHLGTTSGAGFKLPPVAPNSIVSSFGADLATKPLSSDVGTDPLNLAGTSVSVKDSTGATFSAGLFFVSQLQVNYLMPAQTASGVATITVTSGDGTVTTGSVAIAPVAPSIFELNANHLIAAVPVLYHADNTNTVSQIFSLDSQQNVLAAPVDLGSATDQLYLSIYGTGLRNAAKVTATVADVPLPVAFFGATPQYPGEDQVNLLLPHNLAGAGKVTLILTADGLPSNPVTLTIK